MNGIPSAADERAIGVLAHAYVSAGPEEMKSLRQNPGSFRGQTFPVGQLKHLDDQTIVALAATLRAAATPTLANQDLGDWSVLAAPRFIGRAGLAPAFAKFKADGAWSASPHSIPHRCLHSTSGTLSQMLKLHGPNFGCGGGPGGDGEAFLSAASLLATEPLPGLWLVLTGHFPEHEPPRSDMPAPWTVHALAFALLPTPTSDCEATLRVLPPQTERQADLRCEEEDLFLLRLLPLLETPGTRRTLAPCSGGPLLSWEPTAMSLRLAA